MSHPGGSQAKAVPAPTLQYAIEATSARIRRARILHRTAVGLGWGLLGAGAIVLVGRLTAPHIAWAGLGAALAVPLIVLAVAVRRSGFPLVEAAVLLDRRGRLEGYPLLLLADPRSDWIRQAREVAGRAAAAIPRVSLAPFVRRVLPGAAFLGAAALLPQVELFAPPPAPRDSAGARQVERLAERLEMAQEKNILSDGELQALKEELARLDEAARAGTFGQEAWEGSDALEERLHQTARERAAALGRAAWAAGQLVDSLDPGALDQALAAEALESLLQAVAASPNPALPPDLARLLEEIRSRGGLEGLDPEAVKEAMSELRERFARELRELVEAAEEGHRHAGGG